MEWIMSSVEVCVARDGEEQGTKRGTLEVLGELTEEVSGKLKSTEKPKPGTGQAGYWDGWLVHCRRGER